MSVHLADVDYTPSASNDSVYLCDLMWWIRRFQSQSSPDFGLYFTSSLIAV